MYTLTRSDLTEVPMLGRVAWSIGLTVTSSDAERYPPKVFVYQVEDPEDENSRAWFTAVASPAQLEEYAEDAPTPPGEDQQWQPYFRSDTVQLVSRNADALEDLYADFCAEIARLRQNIDAIDNLTEGTSIEL